MPATMDKKVVVGFLALVGILSIFFAPWATIHRELGAKGTALLLPNRIIDFTGDILPLEVPNQVFVLLLSLTALSLIALASLLKDKMRLGIWFLSGVMLVGITVYGYKSLDRSLESAKVEGLAQIAEQAIAKPRRSTDVEKVKNILERIYLNSSDKSIRALKAAGVRVRNLPYSNSAMGLSAFLSIVVGLIAIIFSLRFSSGFNILLDKLLHRAAIPTISILLALVAAAIVILALQPTPLGKGVEISNAYIYLVGRLDTLWYAYQTIFASSLGNISGFLEALKFATPLIFTGLAVAFSFRAGLFNIGAPGQMILGAVFAMLVGIYMPGPKFLVLPLAVLAAALGGGLWGALPGWLKAKFGANEVINTILLNYIASSILLFLLSASHTFAAPALRILIALLVFAFFLLFLNLIPQLRNVAKQFPFIVGMLISLTVVVIISVASWPRSGDSPITFTLPFKAPGSEPKSQLISEEARFEHLPALMGIDLEKNPGTNIVSINYSLIVAILITVLVFIILPNLSKAVSRLLLRITIACLVGAGVYAIGMVMEFNTVSTAIPPTQLNGSFVLAILAAVFVYYFLWRTKWGYELRAGGLSPKAAEYGGANLARNTVLAMSISGALAGLTACHYVLGGALEEYSLRQSLPTSDGFDGIAVALLGYNTPLGVVLSAFLFGVLKNGGAVMNVTFPELTRDVVNMMLALIVLFIAAKGFLPESLTNFQDKTRK